MEREIMIKIICYAGGTCGDLITALFDSQGAYFRGQAVMFDLDRMRLKKPHTFENDIEKDQYIENMSTKYQSIPSHDLHYHVRQGHEFIGIVVSDWQIALWAATRFKQLHRPHAWEEMIAACGATSVEDYAQIIIDFSKLIAQHTDKIITLESIRKGTALQNPLLPNAGKNFYQNWQDLQNGLFLS